MTITFQDQKGVSGYFLANHERNFVDPAKLAMWTPSHHTLA